MTRHYSTMCNLNSSKLAAQSLFTVLCRSLVVMVDMSDMIRRHRRYANRPPIFFLSILSFQTNDGPRRAVPPARRVPFRVDRRRAAAESVVRVRSSKTSPRRRRPVPVPPFTLPLVAAHSTNRCGINTRVSSVRGGEREITAAASAGRVARLGGTVTPSEI